MTVEQKLVVHLEHIVMPEGVRLNGRQINLLISQATPEDWKKALKRSQEHIPFILPEELVEAQLIVSIKGSDRR